MKIEAMLREPFMDDDRTVISMVQNRKTLSQGIKLMTEARGARYPHHFHEDMLLELSGPGRVAD